MKLIAKRPSNGRCGKLKVKSDFYILEDRAREKKYDKNSHISNIVFTFGRNLSW